MTRCRSLVCCLVLIFVSSLFSQGQVVNRVASSGSAKHKPGELLVKFRPSASAAAKLKAHAAIGATSVKVFRSVRGLELARVPATTSLGAAIAAYRANPAVEYVEPNFIVHAFTSPDDPSFIQQWSLHNTGQNAGKVGADIGAEQAWTLSTGSQNVVVVSIDSGVDYTHPDLSANFVYSTVDCAGGTAPGGACYGKNAIANAPHPGDPMDDFGHGTHTAGTIGAVGNNSVGVSGVNWTVGLMACKFMDQTGSGTTADAITCLDYVKDLKDSGVRVVATNNSWGGADYSQALHDAIQAQMQDGILFIAAAGNNSSSNDVVSTYPASFDLPNIISVAATDHRDQLAGFSDTGAHSVSIAAPGTIILSTLPGGQYGFDTGTSMAAPHVTGVAALLAAQNPSATWYQIKNLILAGGDSLPALAGQTVSGRRLNAYGAMTCSSSPVSARLQPTTQTLAGTVGSPIVLRMLNINCAAPAGGVTVNVTETGENIALVDDGTGADQAAGDGVYSGQWTPSKRGEYTLNFPNGDVVIVTVLGTYTPTKTSSAYTNIDGTSLNLGDDSVATLDIPFSINFGGAAFSQLYVSSNGTISLTNSFGDYFDAGLPNANATTLIAPFWSDLYPVQGSAQNVYWQVVGSAPSRQLVIEWRNVREFACKDDANATVRFEVVFDEADANVQFNYASTEFNGDCSYYNNGGGATIGVQTSATSASRWSSYSQSVSAGTSLLWQLDLTPPSNPVPVLTSLSPSSVPVGSPETVITLNGSNFVPNTMAEMGGLERPTTYISNTQVQVLLPPSDMAWGMGQYIYISAVNPAPGGGTSQLLTLNLTSTPVISAISPSSVAAGSFDFSLVVSGSGFTVSSVVYWNDVRLSTTTVSPTQSVAVVAASLVTAPGTATIKVDDGSGQVSNSVTFTIAPAAQIRFQPPLYRGTIPPPAVSVGKAQRFLGWKYASKAGPVYLKQFQRRTTGPIDPARAARVQAESQRTAAGTNASMPDINVRPMLPAGFIPSGITTGDFNHDGKLDWAICNGGDNTVWVFLGNGDGSWQLPTIIPLFGFSPVWITSADLRGIGVPDLIVAEADSGSVGILLGNGDGTFQPEQEIYLSAAVTFVAVADMNQDGKPDIVAALNGGNDSLSVLPGNGDGTFGTAITSPGPLSFFYSPENIWMAIGDLDGDGIPDVVTVDYNTDDVIVYLNRGDGTLKYAGIAASGDPEGGLIYVSANVGDLNHDGCADIVATDTYLDATIYLGNCQGTFDSTGQPFGIGEFTVGSLLADVDGDGNLDLVAGGYDPGASGVGQNSGALLSVMLGDGKGGFANPRLYRGGLGSAAIAAADINGDGKIDVLAANEQTDSVTLFLNNGQGGFGSPEGEYVGVVRGTPGGINSPISSPIAVDINGDGRKDLALFQFGNDSTRFNLSVMLNDGSGHFGPPINSPVMPSVLSPWGVVFGDFRRVGHPDVVITPWNDGGTYSMFYAKGDGNGNFSGPSLADTTIPPGALLAVGDFNGDGLLDIAAAYFAATGNNGGTPVGSQCLSILLGHGDGTFTTLPPIQFGTLGTLAEKMFVGDFNGDGKVDVLIWQFQNVVPYTNHDVWEFLGNGDGTFQAGKVVIPNADDIEVADLNHDGRPDIVEFQDPMRDYPSDYVVPQVRVYLGQSDGSFPLSYTYAPYNGKTAYPYVDGKHRSAWFGDFNGDGNMDVAVFQSSGSRDGGYVQFLVGNGDGSFTPSYHRSELHSSAIPSVAIDINGKGKDDLVELDWYSSSFHVLPSGIAPAFDIATVADPVPGTAGLLRLTFNVPPAAGTTVALSASDPAISIPASISYAGDPWQDVPFSIGSQFNPLRAFSLQGAMGASVDAAYGTQALVGSSLGFNMYSGWSSRSTTAGSPTTDYMPGVVSIGGYATTLNLSCSGLPAGAACGFGTDQLELSPGQTVGTTLIVNTSLSVPPGTYQFTFNASDGAQSGSLPLQLVVTQPLAPDFALNYLGNSEVNTQVGGVASYSFAVTSTPSFTGTIAYSCNGLPSNASCSFPSAGTLQVTTAGAAPGNYSFNLVGTSGTITHSVAYTLVLAGLSARVNPSLTTMLVGSSATFVLTLTPVSQFTQTVSLSCPNLSSALQCSFDKPQVTFDGSTTQTVSLTIKANSSPSTASASHNRPLLAAYPLAFAALVWIGKRGRRPAQALVLSGTVAVIWLLCFLTACGGGGGSSTPPPPSSATVTINVHGTGNNYTQQLVAITLTVQQ